MNNKTVKTYIGKLLKRYPYKKRYELLAKELGVTTRHIRYLEKGESVPSEPLRKLIKILLNQA
jgi:DNA-binding transcriptional regulator YiaG